MNKRMREERDNLAAKGAIEMARQQGKKVGIGVDDLIKVERMVDRVKALAELAGIAFTVEPAPNGKLVKFDKGQIYVFAADALTGNPGS